MTLLVYIIICVLIIGMLVILTFAVNYNRLAYECSTHQNPWCFNNWKCKAPPEQASIDRMISGGILPVGATAGTEYDLATTIYLPTINKCSYQDEQVWIDVITKLPCNASNNPNGDPNNSNCKQTPYGCLTNIYGELLTQSEIWGSRG
jgi:hypothetical protein